MSLAMGYYVEDECRCGCGESLGEVSRATYYRLRGGYSNAGWKSGHRHREAGNPRWKGGEARDHSGYRLIAQPGHPMARASGYVLEHRYVMSEALGRPLRDEELVHHVNGDKLDNRLENLRLVTREAHTRHHSTGARNGRWKPPEPKACATCGRPFLKKWNQTRDRYCSRRCMNIDMLGEKAPHVKLSDAQVAEIRRLRGQHSQRQLAAMFGVGKSQIARIHRGESR